MELLESLLVNKKNFIILASIYFLVVIGILVWIWWPDTVVEQARYEPYDETSKNNEMFKYYASIFDNYKLYDNLEYFKTCISDSYLSYTGITASEAFDMLKNTDSQYYLNNYNLYKYGDKYIYSYVIPSGSEELRVNIIEKEYPYRFYVTYGTFVNYSDFLNYGSIIGAKIKIISTYNDLNYVEYELSVSNEEHDSLTLDLSNADNFCLELEDGSTVKLNILQSTQDKLVVEKGETEVTRLAFKVEIEDQTGITALTIKNISDGTKKYIAEITF